MILWCNCFLLLLWKGSSDKAEGETFSSEEERAAWSEPESAEHTDTLVTEPSSGKHTHTHSPAGYRSDVHTVCEGLPA